MLSKYGRTCLETLGRVEDGRIVRLSVETHSPNERVQEIVIQVLDMFRNNVLGVEDEIDTKEKD